MGNVRNFFTTGQQQLLIDAIREAEAETSGEIRLHLDASCDKNVFERALEVFNKLNMHQTKLQNGVLFYLAIDTRDFVIIGDKGINDLVPENFWDEVKDLVISSFKQGNFIEGLTEGIKCCGSKLKTFFPYQSDDINELVDEISFGD